MKYRYFFNLVVGVYCTALGIWDLMLGELFAGITCLLMGLVNLFIGLVIFSTHRSSHGQ